MGDRQRRAVSGAAVPPLLEPRDRTELRGWLEENHALSSGVRLAIGKKGNRVTELSYDDAVEEGLCFGWIDGTARRLDADRYTVLFTPRKPGSTWAASNKERVARLEAAGLMRPAGKAAVERAKAEGSWSVLDDIDAFVVPDDLEAALATTPGAKEGFAALTASARKLALYRIVSAKRPETRARRIAETASAAAEGRASR